MLSLMELDWNFIALLLKWTQASSHCKPVFIPQVKKEFKILTHYKEDKMKKKTFCSEILSNFWTD